MKNPLPPWNVYAANEILRINQEEKFRMAGWVKVTDRPEVLQAIRESKVPSDGMVLGGSIWTARWVREALETYRRNEGYADLSLTEFLQKLNDQEQKK